MNDEETKDFEIKTISELVEGHNIFGSDGYSIVKVTRGGEEKSVRLPIKSTGVAEFMSELEGRAPRPPMTRDVIKKGSPEGRELGLPHDKICLVFDTTDEKYIDALNKHNQDYTWQVAIFALDLPWKLASGAEAETFEEKKRILQSNGITWHHINRIFKDVQELTQFAEDREDFLSES